MQPNDSIQVFSDRYLENISDAFRTIYTEEHLSDVTIHCKEGSVKAHKLILAANSPYFYKIFRENRKDNPIVILNGISLNQLKNLMDLLYHGIVDVPNSNVEAVSSLVDEFEIKGVVFGQRASNNVRLELREDSQTLSPDSAYNRDTRFRGQKRVAVDFVYEEDKCQSQSTSTNSSINTNENPLANRNNQDAAASIPMLVKREMSSPAPSSENSNYNVSRCVTAPQRRQVVSNGAPKLNAWAKKQRKFKCDLCPSSFKRSSHLSRHQLVHTGERPYSCSQCEKAFSRHDKLKHHVKKSHEFIPDSMYESIDVDELNEDSESEASNRNYSSPPQNSGVGNGPSTSNSDYAAPPSPRSFHREDSPLFTISHISSILEDSFVTPPKKGRGRPRKYPPAGSPTVELLTQGSPKTADEETVVPNQENIEDPSDTNKMATSLRIKGHKRSELGLPKDDSTFVTSRTLRSRPKKAKRVRVKRDELKLTHKFKKVRRLLKCDSCEKRFRKPSLLEIHKLEHVEKRFYHCNKCSESFVSKNLLSRHRSDVHEFIPDYMYERIDMDDMVEYTVDELPPNMNFSTPPSPFCTIASVSPLGSSLLTSSKRRKFWPRAPPQPLIKRGRGRPRLNQVTVAPSVSGPNNYDITNLPYGDLNYLTSQTNEGSATVEETIMLEPLVEINTEQTETSRNVEKIQNTISGKNEKIIIETSRFMEQAVIEPFVEIQTDNIKKEKTDHDQAPKSFSNIDISEIETKIGLIGECTISEVR